MVSERRRPPVGSWVGRQRRHSEPQVSYAAPVAGQVFPGVESVEVIDRDMGYRSRLGQPQVDGDSAATLLGWFQRTPIGDTTALRTEMEAERISADVSLGRTRD